MSSVIGFYVLICWKKYLNIVTLLHIQYYIYDDSVLNTYNKAFSFQRVVWHA